MKNYREKIQKTPLNLLPELLSKVESRIYDMIRMGQGSSANGKIRELKNRRNALRYELSKKLLEWEKNPESHKTPTYSQILELEKQKRFKENFEIKEGEDET